MNDPVCDLSQALSRDGDLKVWSVIVTCLGDVSREGVSAVSGLVLSDLVARIGLQPQAMRVALHRLKRDGWIESRREGRVGFHGLSPSALRQARAVDARLYGPAAGPVSWHLVGLPPDAPDGLALLPEEISAIAISRSFALVTGELEGVPDDWLVASPSARGLPAWVRDVVAEAACEEEFNALHAALSTLDALSSGALPRDPLTRFALRVLVLHGWRRLALRSNPAAEAALGDGRAEIACRARVHTLLNRLGPVPASVFGQGV